MLDAQFFTMKKNLQNCIVMNKITQKNKRYELINQGTTAQLTLFGFIDWWSDDNNSVAFKNEIDALLQAGIRNVNGYINCGGGDVFEANEIKNQIERFSGVRSCLIGSLCASAGTMVMMGFQKEHVSISSNGFLMYHEVRDGNGGTIRDLKRSISLIEKLEQNYINELMAWTGKSKTDLQAMLEAETWLNAEEAVTQGFVSKIANQQDGNTSIFASLNKQYIKNAPKLVASLFVDQESEIIKNQNLSTMKIEARNSITGMLALPATATDEDITASVKKVIDNAALAETRATNAKKEANKIVAKIIVTAAVTDKKITEEESVQYLQDAEENPELVGRIFAKMQTPIKASAFKGEQGNLDDADKANWTFSDYQSKDEKGLAEMKEKTPIKYEALYKAHYKREV
jgi:ATP-dependent Clp protease protease subunit